MERHNSRDEETRQRDTAREMEKRGGEASRERESRLERQTEANFTYNTLIQGFCQSGKLNVAKELFQEMVSQGAYPDIVTWYFDGWVV
ncbi:hypothetical protein DY000_02057819 [Brassica cretica]|uniref:Pentatricopeptide repeat-containing protein n=1 Tax=Brassica cretica TaxID=69181 RepID=A0ABQ7AMI4_BRACR|nr:hypothetical protein DY000_02057819 [Brassica cretica]